MRRGGRLDEGGEEVDHVHGRAAAPPRAAQHRGEVQQRRRAVAALEAGGLAAAQAPVAQARVARAAVVGEEDLQCVGEHAVPAHRAVGRLEGLVHREHHRRVVARVLRPADYLVAAALAHVREVLEQLGLARPRLAARLAVDVRRVVRVP